jgi:cytochrome P450
MGVYEASVSEDLARVLRSDPVTLRDPWPVWRELREAGPVHESGEITVVTRFEDVRALAKDPRLSNSYHAQGARAEAIAARLEPDELAAHEEVCGFESMYVSRTDGDDHDRLRKIMHRAFTPRRMAELTERVEQYTTAILDDCVERGECEWMADMAVRLPMMMIAELLGVPQDEREQIRDWSGRLARNRGGENPELLMDAHRAMTEFRSYVEQEVLPRRNELGGSELARAFVNAAEGETLSPKETTAQFVVLLFAGFETTSTLIGAGLLELLRHPEQWKTLVDDPGFSGTAVEELLRWVTPVQWIGRVALEDIEVGGETIPKGRTVYPCLATANRDPEAFVEPETFDLRREDARKHLAFGLGPHFCLGNALARIEAQVVFEQMARHFPEVALVDDDPPWGSNAMLRGIQRLPIILGPKH